MRLVCITLWLSIGLILAACIPVSGSPAAVVPKTVPTTTATTLSTATSTPTTVPAAQTPQPTAATAALAGGFQFYDGNPVLSGSLNWDRVYIDPGAVVFHDGLLHMFYNGIDGFPRPVGVGYATSKDGIHWDRQVTEPLFHASDLYPNDPKITNLFVTSGLVQADGTWVLYFYTLESSNFIGPQSIGRATAPGPKGPWKADPQMALDPGPVGAWDSLQVGSPNVLTMADGYVMYYDGMGQDGHSMIGRATSPDGSHWTKYNDPVLKPDPSGWDSKRVIDPNILPTSKGWKMIYLSTTCTKKFGSCEYNLGQAASSDGIHWNKAQDNPILSSKDYQDWQASYLVTLIQNGGSELLYMDYSGKKAGGTRVYLATPKKQAQP